MSESKQRRATQFDVRFKRSGRGKARCPSDPRYPNGVITDLAESSEEGCWVDVPYPAPECGAWMIHCNRCDSRSAVTAAGRPDDPVRVRLPCKRADSPDFALHIAPEHKPAPRPS